MLKSGFFNSINGDRSYDAYDMGRLFDGIIRDGVFLYSGEHLQADDGKPWPLSVMEVNDPDVLAVQVAPGRAWFNGTWTDLSRDDVDLMALYLEIEPNSGANPRYDYVVLIVDKRENSAGRKNTIRVLQNSPAYGNEDPDIHTYVLAKVTVGPNAGRITSQNIELYIGRDVCTVDGTDYPAAPWVTAPLEKVGIEPLFAYWYGQTNTLIDAAVADYFNGLTVATKPEVLGGGHGVCDTAANVSAKTAVITDFIPTDGGIFSVKFINDVPGGATLNINNGTSATGAKSIYYRGVVITSSAIRAGETVTFTYDASIPCYRILAVDSMYRKPAGGIPSGDLKSEIVVSLGKADTAYQKPSEGIPETDLDSSVQNKLNSGSSGQGATFVHITESSGSYFTDTTSYAIYQALQNGDANYIAIDPDGRECLLISPPSNNVSGQAIFGTFNSFGTAIIIYTFGPGTSTVVNGTQVNIPSNAYVKPSGGIPESDLASAVQSKLPLQVEITWDGSDFVSNKTYAQIYAAFSDGQPIDVSIDNMYGWFGSVANNTAIFYAVDKNYTGYPLLYIFEVTASSITSSSKVLGDGLAPIVVTDSSASPSNLAAAANTIYKYTAAALTSLTVSSFPGNGDFSIQFNSGSTATVLTLPQTLDDRMPPGFTVATNTRYEIAVSDGWPLVASWAVSS